MNIFKLVTSNLFRRKGRFVFTLLGISIGMASFVALLSIGGNMQSVVRKQADGLGASFLIMPENMCIYNQMAIVTGETPTELLSQDTFENLKSLSEVTIIPHLALKAGVFNDSENTTMTSVISGILPDETRLFKGWELQEGEFFSASDVNEVVVGSNFAVTRDLQVGDMVELKNEEFLIRGILAETGGNDDMTMFVPLSVAQRVFEKGENISYMSAKVKDIAKIEEYSAEILAAATNVQVATDEQLLGSVLSIIGSVNVTLQLIAVVALIAAAFGIINTMMTAVYERRREIGVLMAIGGKGGTIFKIFVIESGLYGLFGGLVGVLAGYGVSVFAAPIINREGLEMLRGVSAEPSMDITLAVTAIGLSLVIATVSGIFPAIKAARLTPVEAINNG